MRKKSIQLFYCLRVKLLLVLLSFTWAQSYILCWLCQIAYKTICTLDWHNTFGIATWGCVNSKMTQCLNQFIVITLYQQQPIGLNIQIILFQCQNSRWGEACSLGFINWPVPLMQLIWILCIERKSCEQDPSMPISALCFCWIRYSTLFRLSSPKFPCCCSQIKGGRQLRVKYFIQGV